MAGLCSELDHPAAATFMHLLSLNDSMLINYELRFNLTISELPAYRHRLFNILVSKIPGKLMTECIFHNWLWILIPVFIVAMGSIGNFLSAVVLCRRSMTHISSYIYLATLAIFDEIILLCGLFRKWIEHVTDWSLENHSVNFCKLFQVIGVSSSLVSVWLIVTLTVERVLIIKRPFEASKYAKASRAKYIIISLMIISFTISCHFFETVSLHNENDKVVHSNFTNKTQTNSNQKCQFKMEYAEFSNVWFFVDGAFYSWIPLILLIITNLIILMEIYKARNIHNSMINTNHNTSKTLASSVIRTPLQRRMKETTSRNRETKQLTVMLLIVSLSFLLTTSPLVLLKLLIKFKGNPVDIKSLAQLVLLDGIFEMLMYVNHAINFYLYCATGNKFRQQLVKILFCQSSSKFSTTTDNKIGKYYTTTTNNNINNIKSNQFEETIKESIYLKGSSNRFNYLNTG